MRESKLKQLWLLLMLGVILLAEPVSIARTSRKNSSSSSSSGSSRSRPSSGSSSHRTAPSSRPSISSRSLSVPRSSSTPPRDTSRGYRKIAPESGTSSNTRGSGRIYTPRAPQSNLNTFGLRDSNSRISRKSDTTSSYPSSTLSSSRVDRKLNSYSDYPYTRRSIYHYHRDYYPSHRIFYWISWPDCCRPICYTWGPCYSFGFFWPFYHRKFIFVSIGGYWPCYSYRRYYWYGCHPYRWYGDYPPEYVIAGNTYNYYYYGDNAPQEDALGQAHRKLEEKPPAEPADESQTDRYFDQGVKAFEAGDYTTATAKFQDAMKLTPDDIVLPFAHVQALFANGEYEKAADGLRKALVKVSPDKEGVFYPRGLYPDDNILQKQVEQLTRVVQLNRPDSNLELLLGYQLLGMGRYDEAVGHLQNAELNSENNQAATVLMNLLEKLKKANKDNVDSDKQQAEKPVKLQSNNPKSNLTGQGEDTNANASKKLDDKDIDFRTFAMSAENWLAKN